MKAIIFDSSTLITLTINGLDSLLRDIKKNSQTKFIVTNDVAYETVKRPLNIKRFELEALKIEELMKEKVLETPESIGIKSQDIEKGTKEILDQTNKIFRARNNFIHIIDLGEASCLALSNLLTKKGIENVIAVDERTTRVLYENPQNLRDILKSKLHTGVELSKDISQFSNQKYKFIRSVELVFYAYKKGLISLQGKQVLDALLYASKFKGCSVSDQEIEEMKRM